MSIYIPGHKRMAAGLFGMTRRNFLKTAAVVGASVANPIKFSQTKIEYSISPPMLGEHTKHILNSILDIGDDEISRLEKDKIIYCG